LIFPFPCLVNCHRTDHIYPLQRCECVLILHFGLASCLSAPHLLTPPSLPPSFPPSLPDACGCSSPSTTAWT
jgi:hypothetical protein